MTSHTERIRQGAGDKGEAQFPVQFLQEIHNRDRWVCIPMGCGFIDMDDLRMERQNGGNHFSLAEPPGE